MTTPTHPHPPPPSQNIPLPTFIPQLTDMLKYKLLFQTFTYLGWESSIKYLGGNQIETFTLTYNTYTSIHTRTFSFANYITDNVADIHYRHYSKWQRHNTTFTFKRLLNSGNCMNLSGNGDQGNKVKTKEVEVWSWIFSFSSVYASNLSHIFMDKMNLLY